MNTWIASCIVFVIALSAAAPSPAHAQWIEDGAAICTENYTQEEPVTVPDGSGGSFIAWQDYRNGYFAVYVQHIDARGMPLWAAGGIRTDTAADYHGEPGVASDCAGGVVVTWSETGVSADIYVQRIDRDGNLLWGASGVALCSDPGDQYNPAVCYGSGGAIIAWEDNRNGNSDIYARGIDPSGTPKWTPDGVPVCTDAAYQARARIESDAVGGAYICWQDNRGDGGIYGQRLTSTGSYDWTYNGLAVCDETGTQFNHEMISVNGNYIIVAWVDHRGSDHDIYAQSVSYYGSLSWTAGGVAVCAAADMQNMIDISPDGEWGAVIVWKDHRDGESDIFAQKIRYDGALEWTVTGEPVCLDPYEQWQPQIVSDGAGGAIVAWTDKRYGGIADIFVQRIAAGGGAEWDPEGVPLCTAAMYQYALSIVSDGAGGAILSWMDERNGEYSSDIYAQRVERNGYWGYPSPSIVSVRDVPGDEGGYVSLAWDASRLDLWPESGIDHYGIWRALDEEAAAMLLAAGSIEAAASPSGGRPKDGPGIVRADLLNGEPYYWQLIGTVAAEHYREHYSEIVETLFDSTGVSDEYQYFQVVAYTDDPLVYWESSPDSGRSVDDLAPAAPLGLIGEQWFTPNGLQLTWDPNGESDLAGYNIYRGTSGSFEPGPGSFVASTPDTAAFDGDWSWDTGYWYKVAAVDIHGNVSGYAVFGPDMVTSDDPMPVPDATFLSQNFPNPFNPITNIGFGIKEQGDVSLRIYDASGRLVTTLIDESRPAGRYTTEWNGQSTDGSSVASGVYFYRLRAGNFVRTRKMVLLR